MIVRFWRTVDKRDVTVAQIHLDTADYETAWKRAREMMPGLEDCCMYAIPEDCTIVLR